MAKAEATGLAGNERVIRARYGLHRHLLGNRRSRRRFRRDGPQLTEGQRHAVAELSENGICTMPFAELTGDERLWEALAGEMATYRAEVEAELPADRTAAAKKTDFLIRRRRESFAADDPWVRFGASSEVLGIVNAYRGLWTRLIEIDQWYTVPFPDAKKRVASQNWHRDPEDLHIIKLFVYFSDVDEEAGPFEYIPGSPAGGRYGDLWPWQPLGGTYPPDKQLQKKVGPSDRVLLTGSAGTVVFCDTSGLHRGGFARSKPRLMSKHTYVSPASLLSKLQSRSFEIKPTPDNGLAPAARFALS